VGGSPNGSTTEDRTNYLQTFSSNALDLAMFIESDRMGYLLDAMSPASVEGQRDVVKNERRQSYDNRPYGLASQLIAETLYPADYPYHWPVIGYMDDLSAASFQDVVDFFRTYYAPNNASLAISGDFEPAEARKAVEKWFAEVPRGPAVDAVTARPPAITTETRILLEDRVQLPRVYMSWITPAAYAEGDAALTALGRVLASGRNSRLYRRLVYELQIADDVSAAQNASKLSSEFTITATARSGHDLEEIRRVIDEELEHVRTEPPAANELARVVNQYETAFLEQLESASAKANRLNEYLYYTGTPDYFEQDLQRYRMLKPADLSAAAKQFLAPTGRVLLSIVPRGTPELGLEGSRAIPSDDLPLSPDARKPRT
jgi:zinc protease